MYWREILLVLALAAPEFSAEETRRLEAGEILTWTQPVEGRSVPRMKATGVVDFPPAAVWPIIDDCAHFKDTMPRTVASEELERRGDHVSCRVTADMPFPFSDLVTVTDAIHTVEPGKLYRREWKQRSGDFDVNEGRWTLVPWHEGKSTLVTYEALAEPKVAIPDAIIRVAMRRTLPDMIASLRRVAEREAKRQHRSE